MENLEEIKKTICEMQQELHTIIDEKHNLLHPEVIAASQKLDVALNEYNNIINKNFN
jgi:uncharacterized protein involved in tolerance to divalent cations